MHIKRVFSLVLSDDCIIMHVPFSQPHPSKQLKAVHYRPTSEMSLNGVSMEDRWWSDAIYAGWDTTEVHFLFEMTNVFFVICFAYVTSLGINVFALITYCVFSNL